MKIDEKILKTNIKTFKEVKEGEVFIIIATNEVCLKLKQDILPKFVFNCVCLSNGVPFVVSAEELVSVKDAKLVNA